MDKQTVYKSSPGYYEIQKNQLLERGYKIVKDTDEYTVFEKENMKTTSTSF